LVQSHATANSAFDPVPDRFCTRHGIGPACGFLSAVCTRERWFPVLRSVADENLCLGRNAFAFRHRVRHRWGVATGSGALACSHLFPGDSPVLVRVGDGGIVFPLAADPGGPFPGRLLPRIAARSDPDSAADSLPESVAIPARWCGRLGAPGGGVAGMRFLAVLRTGWNGDTPPLKGCCTVTFGYRVRTC
jgi:hypothetical protein